MEKIKTRIISIALCAVVSMSTATFGHSGRTDSSGGHKDNKNASGLGSYHYHCGGYSAHLHSGGVCPYTTPAKPSTNTKTTTSNTTTASATVKKEQTNITDIKTYIDDIFIPSFNYKEATYIIAEDLEYYGYGVEWNNDERTLYIKKADKEVTGVKGDNPKERLDIITTDIKTMLYIASEDKYKQIESYNIEGKTIVDAEKLNMKSNWDGVKRELKLTTD